MALHDEHADILGGPIMQRPDSDLLFTFSRHDTVFKSFILFGFSLLAWIACARGLQHLKKHRELGYRKAMRRKHGIPDSDCRPFAVAYAAAKRAHLEREAQDRKKVTNYVSDHNPPAVDQRTTVPRDARGLRRRVPETTLQFHDYQLPEGHDSLRDNKLPDVHSLKFSDRYNPSSRHQQAILDTLPVKRRPVRSTYTNDLVINLDDQEGSRKRSFEDEGDAEHETIKKSRIDGDELIDGDGQADWYAQYADMPPRRAFDEFLDRQSEKDHVQTNSQEKSKRVNGIYDEDHEPVDEAMEGVDEDEVAELEAVARGRKRDRAEAGSSFGGDDEEDVQNGRASHCRKRRTILGRSTEMVSRGQKRDRAAGTPESEAEGGDSETSRRRARRSSKIKRGKNPPSDEVSEILVEDSRISKDPLCDGRGVGDEWEIGGVQYKVGDRGERLRLTLVKKTKNRYRMPQDSQHPDRPAALEIYVEAWMTEEQYKRAEERQELVWQEAPRELNGSKTPDILDSPTKNGKNLLWDSVKGSPARRSFRQFMPAGASTRNNPFEQWQLQNTLGRRVASSSTIVSPMPAGVDSPTRPGLRGFSKWEKQDREAEAMARIRAKIDEQKKAQGPPQKSTEIPTSTIVPELATKALFVPTVSPTSVPAVPGDGKLDSKTSSSELHTATVSFVTPPGASVSVTDAATVASTTTPGFSLPPTSLPMATPTTLFPNARTASVSSSTTSSSPFSSVKPLQVSSSTTATTSLSAMPNFTGKGVGSGTPSLSTPSPVNLGLATRSQPSSTESAPKPFSFSFTKHGTPSSSPPTTKFQVPVFDATSRSTPTVEAPISLPVSTSAKSSESSKLAVPPFSFPGASSLSTVTPSTSSTPSLPKFSFGQPVMTSTTAPGFNLVQNNASQPKPTFRFGQTPPSATNSASASTPRAADESKKSALPMSVFTTTTSLNEPARPSPFEATSTFGSSTSGSPSVPVTSLFGKPVIVGGDNSISIPSKSTLAPTNITTFSNPSSSMPAGIPASGNIPVFSFDGTNTGFKSVEESGPTPLFGGATGGTKPVSLFGATSTEGKSSIIFSTSTEGSKSTSMLGGNTENLKLPSVFGRSAGGSKPTFEFGGSAESSKPTSMFGGAVEGSKPIFTLSGATEDKSMLGPAAESSQSKTPFAAASDSSLPVNTIGVSKAVTTLDDAATNTSTTSDAQAKPTTSFTFGVPSSMTGSTFGQPFTSIDGDSNQSVFGKPTNAPPTAFGLVGTGGSGSPSTFTFGKPTTQNQKQEQ